MSTLIRSDICVHLPIDDYEKAVIAANRRLAELNIVRVDYWQRTDGHARTQNAADALEQRGLNHGQGD